MPSTRVKAITLRKSSKAELQAKLDDLKKQLSQLRVAQITGNNKVQQIRSVRKSIACVLTVMNQARSKALRLRYKGKKYVPTDLRMKKTRAMRRELTKYEQSRKLHKTIVRLHNIPKRLFVAKKEKADKKN